MVSEDTNPTKLPDVEPLQSGTIKTATRCFDLLCFGKYNSENAEPRLKIEPADKIPNLITKNKDGNIVFSEPSYMCTVQSPRGQNVWINIRLENKNGKLSADYLCLGIKKRGEDNYLDILYTNNTSRYVDVLETDIVELIPLVSSTKLPEYSAVNAGDEVQLDGVTASEFDFGSVYRVHITLHNSQWLMDQPCDLHKVCANSPWHSNGRLGVGTVVDKSGRFHTNQLVEINNRTGQLAYSSDGVKWTEIKGVLKEGETVLKTNDWGFGPAYGNGIWCAVSWERGVRRSIDYGKSWSDTLFAANSYVLGFGNDVFMIVVPSGTVYTSADAEAWTSVGQLPNLEKEGGDSYRILIYGNNEWICGTFTGILHKSKDDGRTWLKLDSNLSKVMGTVKILGGSYVNGYFYVIGFDGGSARSSDVTVWDKLIDFPAGGGNITYCKGKLYTFNENGTKFCVGLLRSDGTIDSKI